MNSRLLALGFTPARMTAWACVSAALLWSGRHPHAAGNPSDASLSLFARTNLVAWCIVPFDGKPAGPKPTPRTWRAPAKP